MSENKCLCTWLCVCVCVSLCVCVCIYVYVCVCVITVRLCFRMRCCACSLPTPHSFTLVIASSCFDFKVVCLIAHLTSTSGLKLAKSFGGRQSRFLVPTSSVLFDVLSALANELSVPQLDSLQYVVMLRCLY